MPEIPAGAADYEQYLPVEDRDDHFVNVQMPRSALRALERDARAHRAAQAQAAAQDPDTQLEDGEADLTGERRALAAGAPPDRVLPGDPYEDARQAHDRVIADGGVERAALGTALNSLVNAANRGDKRVMISDPRRGR